MELQGCGWRAVCKGEVLQLTAVLPQQVSSGTGKNIQLSVSERKKEDTLNPDEHNVQPSLLGGAMVCNSIWSNGRYVHLGQSVPVLLQRRTTLNWDNNQMGLRWDSSALPKVRWPVWIYSLAPPVAGKRDKGPQRVAHPMVRYPSPVRVTRLHTRQLPWSATCREMTSLEHASCYILTL